MLGNALIRCAVSSVYQARRLFWFLTRPNTFGVHAVALTPAGKVVLVRLTYRSGWDIPGGQRARKEPELDAVLRELREEIGLRSWTRCEVADRFFQRIDWKHDTVTLFRVDGVEYAPRRSLEIAEISEFFPDELGAIVPPALMARIAPVLAQPSQNKSSESQSAGQ